MNGLGEEATTNADKARAAEKMGRKLRELGIPHEEAATAAHHELQHGLGDKGKTGKIGIDIDLQAGKIKPYYEAKGNRSTQERLNLTAAATDNPSESDQKRIKELKSQLRTEKIKSIFGLD